MLIPWIVLMLEALVSRLFFDLIPDESVTVSVIVITVNALSLCVGAAVRYRENRDMIYLMIGGFLFRVALFLWDLNCRSIFLLPASGLDTEKYAGWAASGFMNGHYFNAGVYPGFISLWYSFFGVQRPIAQYINILLAMTAIGIVIETMRYMKLDRRVCRTVTALMCFLPYTAIMNAILLRETLIMFLVACSVCFFTRYIVDGSILLLVLSVVMTLAASSVHSGAIAVILGEAIALILYDRRERVMRITPKSIAVTVLLVIGFVAMYSLLQDVLFSKFGGTDSAEDVVAGVERYNAGGSAYTVGFNIGNSTLNLIVNSPIRMLYFVLSPLPWEWRGLTDIVAFLFSSSVFLYAHIRSFGEIVSSPKGRERSLIIILTVTALCCALIFAWGVSNAGTAMRHREKFTMVYMLLIAICDDNRLRRIRSMPVRRKIGNDFD